MADAPKDDVISDYSSFMKDFEDNVRVDDDIPYPVEVAKVKTQTKIARQMIPVGSWVAVRPVTHNPDKKTYLGVYLGDLPIRDATTSYHISDKEMTFFVHLNPAIYCDDLKRVVYGYESWWGPLKKPEDLKQITDRDIDNIWYVKALKELTRESPGGQSS